MLNKNNQKMANWAICGNWTAGVCAVIAAWAGLISPVAAQQPPGKPQLSIPPSEVPAEEIPAHEKSATLFLNHCRQNLRTFSSIDAKMEYAAVLFGEKITGNGIYLEQKSENGGHSFFFQLTHKRDDYHITQNLLLDGQNRKFWQNQVVRWSNPAQKTENPRNKRLETLSQQYSLVNTARIAEAYAQNPQKYPMFAPPWCGASSLENIIFEIQRNFRFYSSAETVLKRLPQEIHVYRAEGEWRKEAVQRILEERKIGASAVFSPANFARNMPEEFPSTVAVYVDKVNYFPYLIEFYRPDESGEQQILLQLSFYEVLFNVRFQPGAFLFQLPPGASEVDKTNEFWEARALKEPATEAK